MEIGELSHEICLRAGALEHDHEMGGAAVRAAMQDAAGGLEGQVASLLPRSRVPK